MDEKNINDLRSRCIEHKGNYKLLAKYGVDYSWLSKFVNGRIPNPTLRTISGLKKALDEFESSSVRDQLA